MIRISVVVSDRRDLLRLTRDHPPARMPHVDHAHACPAHPQSIERTTSPVDTSIVTGDAGGAVQVAVPRTVLIQVEERLLQTEERRPLIDGLRG